MTQLPIWKTLALILLSVSTSKIQAAEHSSPSSSPSSRWNLVDQRRVPQGNSKDLPKSSSVSRSGELVYEGASTNGPATKPRKQGTNEIVALVSGLAKRLRIPSFQTLRQWQNSETFTNVITSCQWAVLGYLLYETYKATRQVYREFMEEIEDMDSPSSAVVAPNGGALLSPAAAQQLVSWLETPTSERGPLPRSIPLWVAGLAQDLKLCSYNRPNQNLLRVFSRLTKQQAILLQSCLLKPTRESSFDTIGGLGHIKNSMKGWIASHCNPSQTGAKRKTPYERLVLQSKQGIVLWGAPGCGKSLLMKAMARESGWPTLVVTPSLLQRKYYGESTNQVRALFSLIATLGPSIVVVDELDGLFRSRSKEEHEVSRELKTEWLQWWDGVASSQLSGSPQVLVVGATNRPWDVDPAVWRRLPQRFYVGVPTWEDRCDLWRKWAISYKLPPIPEDAITHMADNTEGYTPSDLLQVLQTACQMGPIARDRSDFSHVQSLTAEDVQLSLQNVSPTRFALPYIQQLQSFLTPQNWHQAQQQQQQQQQQQNYDPSAQTVYDPSYREYGNGSVHGHTYTNSEPPNGHVWRTPTGNFYQFHIPVQPQVIEALQNIWLKQQEWEPSSDEEDWDEDLDDAPYEDESEEEL